MLTYKKIGTVLFGFLVVTAPSGCLEMEGDKNSAKTGNKKGKGKKKGEGMDKKLGGMRKMQEDLKNQLGEMKKNMELPDDYGIKHNEGESIYSKIKVNKNVHKRRIIDKKDKKIEIKANEANMTPKQFVDGVAGQIRDIWDLMDTSYDKFIRTTDEDHVKQVQKIFKKLYEQGDIYKDEYEGLYCTPCESFLTESQLVDGKCPDCGSMDLIIYDTNGGIEEGEDVEETECLSCNNTFTVKVVLSNIIIEKE